MNLQSKNWEKYIFDKERLGKFALLNLCLLGFSLPITSTIPVLLTINSTPINLGLRIIYLVITLYLITGALLKKQSSKISIGGWLFLLFWILYSIRIFYDVEIRNIRFASSSIFKFYTLAYGSGFLAALATMLNARYIDLTVAKRWIYNTIFLANISIFLMVYYLFKTLNPFQLALRVNFSIQLDRNTFLENVLNPIIISYQGEMLSLLSLYFILFGQSKSLMKNVFRVGFLLGLYILLVGGSRGPFVSFTLLFLFILIVKVIRARKTSLFYSKLFITPVFLLFMAIQFIVPRIPWEKISLFNRMISWLEDDYSNSLDNRDEKFEWAWNAFLENPIFGSQFVDQFNSYPHNIVLESLMAMGIVGGSVLISMILRVFYKTFMDVINHGRLIFFSIIAISQILATMTSGSLFAAYTLWILLAFYFALSYKQKKQPIIWQRSFLKIGFLKPLSKL